MRRQIRDIASDIAIEPRLGLGVKIRLDIAQHRHRARDEIALRDERRIELAVGLVEPVAADHRDIAAGHVARADLEDDRRAFLRSEERTSELQSLMRISYAVFCLTKKKKNN